MGMSTARGSPATYGGDLLACEEGPYPVQHSGTLVNLCRVVLLHILLAQSSQYSVVRER